MSTQTFITEKDLENLKAASSSLKEISESLSSINSFSLASSIADISTIAVNIKHFKKSFEKLETLSSLKLKQLSKIYEKAGVDAVSGMIYQLNLGRHQLDKSISKMIQEGIEKPTKKGLESNSPSKLMMRIAQSIPDGMCLGIEDGLRDVKKSMSKLTDSVEEPAKEVILPHHPRSRSQCRQFLSSSRWPWAKDFVSQTSQSSFDTKLFARFCLKLQATLFKGSRMMRRLSSYVKPRVCLNLLLDI